MRTFGDIVRLLMERRGLTGAALAQEIDLSKTSISKILQGHSKPKQVTFSRLMKSLCTTPEEEQLMVRGFTAQPDEMVYEPEFLPRPIPQDEIERVTRYLEVKSMSVAFERDVEKILVEAGSEYEKDFRDDPYICDFMVSTLSGKLAIDCKFNVNRDWDRTYATAKLLLQNLPCYSIYIVVPYKNKLAEDSEREIESIGGKIVDVKELPQLLNQH